MTSALVALLIATAHAVPPGDIQDPRPGSRVVDLTATLDAGEVEDLDLRAAAAVEAGRGELMVVLVDQLDHDGSTHDGATALFNRWGIGSAEEDDGVLLLLATASGQVEVVLGDGLADRSPESQSVIDDVIVPRLDAGDRAGAIVAGARALEDRVLAPPTGTSPAVGLALGGLVVIGAGLLLRALGRASGSSPAS